MIENVSLGFAVAAMLLAVAAVTMAVRGGRVYRQRIRVLEKALDMVLTPHNLDRQIVETAKDGLETVHECAVCGKLVVPTAPELWIEDGGKELALYNELASLGLRYHPDCWHNRIRPDHHFKDHRCARCGTPLDPYRTFGYTGATVDEELCKACFNQPVLWPGGNPPND